MSMVEAVPLMWIVRRSLLKLPTVTLEVGEIKKNEETSPRLEIIHVGRPQIGFSRSDTRQLALVLRASR